MTFDREIQPTRSSVSLLCRPRNSANLKSGFMQTPILSRRSFIKASTATVFGQAGMSLASALEPKSNPNPFRIEHVGSDDGAVGDGLNAGKMGKMHWRQRLVSIDGVAHLLVLRWRMASAPDLVVGSTADRWESNFYFLCQVRALSSPGLKAPQSASPYMSYDGQIFRSLAGRCRRSSCARPLWNLDHPGLYGALLGRRQADQNDLR